MKETSDYQKQYIRANSGRMYVKTMAAYLKMCPDTIVKIIQEEGLKKFCPAGGKYSGKTKKKKEPVKEGCFDPASLKYCML